MNEVAALSDVMQYAGAYGFPVVVTGYLLVRMESKLSSLEKSINELSRSIDRSMVVHLGGGVPLGGGLPSLPSAA